jgi:hypothetical protein
MAARARTYPAHTCRYLIASWGFILGSVVYVVASIIDNLQYFGPTFPIFNEDYSAQHCQCARDLVLGAEMCNWNSSGEPNCCWVVTIAGMLRMIPLGPALCVRISGVLSGHWWGQTCPFVCAFVGDVLVFVVVCSSRVASAER